VVLEAHLNPGWRNLGRNSPIGGRVKPITVVASPRTEFSVGEPDQLGLGVHFGIVGVLFRLLIQKFEIFLRLQVRN
jgi:hypothetical protein